MEKLEALQERMTARSVPCDTELQELMQQIDMMVNKKKLDWERKMQALEARMVLRDQELASAQSKLDQKGHEVGLLRRKLDSLQKTKFEMAQNYDTQLQALKAQFAKLTQSYEKLQLHQLKQNKARGVEKCSENQEAPFQLSSLNQKLEEFRAKSREWDKQETLYQNHLVSLDAQRKLLSEKCNLFQKQAQNCQIQARCPKVKQDEGDTCSQHIPEHLGAQRCLFTEPTDRNEIFMERLKSTVSDIAVSRNRLQEENLKLQQEVKMYQRKCQNIETRLIEVKNDLQAREDLLSMVELECQELRKEVAKIEEYRNKEENQVKLHSAYAQCIKDLEMKKAQILFLEEQQENQQQELHQIRDRLYREEQSHRSEVERMRTEISDLTEELHQKEITIATIIEKAAKLEKELQTELKIKEKMLGKQQTIDLSRKGHQTHLADPPEYRKERPHSEIFKLTKEGDLPLLVNAVTCFGTNHAKQAKEEKPVQNAAQPATCEHFGGYRMQIPAWHSKQKVGTLERNGTLYPQRSSRDCEPVADGKSPSPPEALSPYRTTSCPERPKMDTFLNHVCLVEENQMPSLEALFPAVGTETFLQEEEKRAKDFEQLLNSHIEELQWQSENTLRKCASLKHRHPR